MRCPLVANLFFTLQDSDLRYFIVHKMYIKLNFWFCLLKFFGTFFESWAETKRWSENTADNWSIGENQPVVCALMSDFPNSVFFFPSVFLSFLEQSLSPRCNKNQQHRRFHILHCSCVCGRCSHSQRGINISVSGRKSVRCRELKPSELNHSVEMRRWKLNISFIWKKHFFKSSRLSVILKAQMIT